MEENKKGVNIQALEGNEFTADSVTVVHRPTKFFFDFSSTTPRIEKGGLFRLVTKHNLAILDPYLAKELIKVLQENVEKYESKFGEIEKPKELDKIEEVKEDKEENIIPENYFG